MSFCEVLGRGRGEHSERDVSYKVIRNGGGYMGRMMKSEHKNMRASDLKV